VPRLDQGEAPLVAIPGAPPNMARLPAGCPFSERCSRRQPQLRQRHARRWCPRTRRAARLPPDPADVIEIIQRSERTAAHA
jgi:oligopeptide/dipeptide ABC transporter ATP-binding protein